MTLSLTQDVLTVSQLAGAVKELLEGSVPLVWVRGEVTACKVWSSGHWYFTLGDAGAQLRCCMWRTYAQRAGRPPADGTSVYAFGRPTLFEGKGECTSCHRIDGVGSRVGPDLSRIGRQRRPGELMAALLEPQAEVQPGNRFYRVVTNAGEEVSGRLLNHDTFTVQLLDRDERLRSFRKAELREHGFTSTPMSSYRDKFSEQELADIVSYLVSRRGP